MGNFVKFYAKVGNKWFFLANRSHGAKGPSDFFPNPTTFLYIDTDDPQVIAVKNGKLLFDSAKLIDGYEGPEEITALLTRIPN